MKKELKLCRYERPPSPCKGCENRRVNCHANCEKYISWKVLCEKSHKEYKKIRAKEIDLSECAVRRNKMFKRKKVKGSG